MSKSEIKAENKEFFTKKVLLFIVEGPTDADTLSPILSQIFTTKLVHFHIVKGDITSTRNNIGLDTHSLILDCINIEKYKSKFESEDILKVIHLVDTDGCFIPESEIIENPFVDKHFAYNTNNITYADKQKVVNRNNGKSSILKQLIEINKIIDKDITFEYAVYFFSRNLEHVLHDKSATISNKEKKALVDDFLDLYEENIDGFKAFISNKNIAVQGNYKETWAFIKEDTNSLNRYTNFHLLFKK